jgi:hypothetical protein
MGTHTPGPWQWTDEGQNHFAIFKDRGGVADGMAIIARLRCEENARLIAAAPDLLAVARLFAARNDISERDKAEARAAIRKATDD